MDIDRIRYFCVVADCGSLVRASEILHISQPALSKAVHLLEHEIGFKLFEREGRGLTLTEDGTKLKATAEPLLTEWLALPARVKGQTRKQIVRIGSFEVFTTYFLRHMMEKVDLPNFELHEYTPGRLEEAIAARHIDVGITYHPISKPGIKFIEVAKIRMSVYGRTSAFQKQSLQDLPFAIPTDLSEGTPSKVMGLDGWPDHKYPRNVQYRVTLMESALELCRLGKAVAYLPDFIVTIHNQVVRKDFELKEFECAIPKKDRYQSVFLVYSHTMGETPFLRTLAKALRELK